jgi:proteasome lid subunit RPN8/RPN11
VNVRQAVLDGVIAHAKRDCPRECCGVLLGRAGEVLEAVAAANVAGSPDRFLLDPKDHIAARRDGRARGLDVVGFYHSHPHSGPRPSRTDLAEAAYPGHLYLIVSLEHGQPEIRVFRLGDGNFSETPFVTVT